ncbi:MAG: tRNA (N(6)-L-threonylcarbamoyladenosine(37)-C(2))-methylthiotransferase MtaB [Synergistaceae bacterium]|nr:tRNA (N(6)-L-threonylcarbamoyladenosine(37)-C(2))-methylthiotransferase MtaB [Synergistaceae bacterium]
MGVCREVERLGETLRGLRIRLSVLGCRSNLYEGEALAGELASRGATVTDKPDTYDAALIVSCSVTAAADKKCRQAVRRARREVDSRGKNGIVAVCGCWAQALDADEARKMGINVLAGNRQKNLLPGILETAVTGEKNFIDVRRDVGGERLWDSLSLERPFLRTRVFLKVQEGCDHFCSYCVIPFLRGRSTSRPLDEVLSEARRVVERGCREIVLTGTHLGMYGRETDTSLAELVGKLSAMSGLARLRMGSLEPFTLDAKLLDALAGSPVFCRHLHLPMQSGDDAVLARMRRGHKAEDFERVCDMAREALGDDLHVSSDVMAAFPGEDDAAFENTLKMMEKVKLGRVHVFPYSPRKGTEAAGFPDQISSKAASERVKAATALGASLLERYASRFAGRNLSVLIEENDGDSFTGYTRNFISAAVRSETELEAGEEVNARMTESSGGRLFGVRA